MIFATNKFLRNMEIKEIGRLLEEDKVERAIEELKRYIAANPKSDKAYFMLGNAYRRKNDWKNAMTNYCAVQSMNNKRGAHDCTPLNILSAINQRLFQRNLEPESRTLARL
jgi:tetratricopeptide (TPR) repeat protein